jgi:hypothetical protein
VMVILLHLKTRLGGMPHCFVRKARLPSKRDLTWRLSVDKNDSGVTVMLRSRSGREGRDAALADLLSQYLFWPSAGVVDKISNNSSASKSSNFTSLN